MATAAVSQHIRAIAVLSDEMSLRSGNGGGNHADPDRQVVPDRCRRNYRNNAPPRAPNRFRALPLAQHGCLTG